MQVVSTWKTCDPLSLSILLSLDWPSQGRRSPWTCALNMRISKGCKGHLILRIIIAWQRAVGGISPIKNLLTATSVQFIPLQGSSAPGLGLMAATCILFPEPGHSRSTLTVFMVLVWKCPMDMRIQRPSNFEMGPVDNWGRGQPPYL